ncbi:nickel-dependent lactate racemase [Rhizobium sp. BK313]|nr:nickel-dependent lactate racemase [Rhizobium sp. BK313]
MAQDPTTLSYGRGHLDIALPVDARATLVRKKPLPKLADPGAAIAAALKAPVGSAPLAELARGRTGACILICDITRPVPNGLFLRPMIETMVASGIPLKAISESCKRSCPHLPRRPDPMRYVAQRG